jgi:hypothetical protein
MENWTKTNTTTLKANNTKGSDQQDNKQAL